VQAYKSKARQISIKCEKPVIYWLYTAVPLFGETPRPDFLNFFGVELTGFVKVA